MPLNEDQIATAEPSQRNRKLYDALGLFLLVTPRGGKWWRFKYRFAGKEKQLALGVWPEVTLSEARLARDKVKQQLKDGIDPSVDRKEKLAKQEADEARKLFEMRFTLENNGALTLRLGKQILALTPNETTDLRTFLDATSAVNGGATNALD